MEKNNLGKTFIKGLQERAKELSCLYKIEELLNGESVDLNDIFSGIIEALPQGFQYTDICKARILFDGEYYQEKNFPETKWLLVSEIKIHNEFFGQIEVYYIEEVPQEDDGPFLKEERKLIDTVSDRIGMFILHQKFHDVFEEWKTRRDEVTGEVKPEWKVALELLKRTDQHTYSIVSRKMINHLFYRGVDEVQDVFNKLGAEDSSHTEVNRPTKKQIMESSYNLGEEVFEMASKHLSGAEIYNCIQKWINEEKSHFLVKILSNPNAPLTEISDSIRRYHHMHPERDANPSALNESIRVSLIRRFLTDQLDFINIAKFYCDVSDFYDMLQTMIFPAESHGKVGGKSAGLFLAKKIIEKSPHGQGLLKQINTPKTWYIASDAIINFIYYNNLDEVIEQRYKSIDEIRQEYSHIVQAFKNSHFGAEITNGISRALDDFGENPIIVRSSSLLEDRMGSAFAGKYKSLFLANQGTKEERLDAITDAIAEVYSSIFAPDPIGYRKERGLLDFHEEMGIMIQEVVGTKVGKYFFPSFAGVAFSHNEFRWSSRIEREDGLIRMVPGLGTRAVDRIGDDYPILIAPGKPELRVNLSEREQIGYSPKNMDVLNLETNTFETVSILDIVEIADNSFPLLNEIFSILEENHLKTPVGLGIDVRKNKDLIVTFENMIKRTDYIKQLDEMLKELKTVMGGPVDIEFACDGKALYLLQCRPQSSSSDSVPAIIPKDISKNKILFSANKFVSNGKLPDITYIVYVDPERYAKLSDFKQLKSFGRAVGDLNKMLPKKNFILMGPGRWGSRDDVRLGVSVTYSDVNNTAALIEIGLSDGAQAPDLSFGTHFFQDLVEASIRYLPLYPGENGTVLNRDFLINSDNILTRFLPEYAELSDVLRVINVPESAGGRKLRILANAEEDEAIGYLTETTTQAVYKTEGISAEDYAGEEPWLWREQMAEKIALFMDKEKFGVKAIYLFGTVLNKTSSNNADIDFLIHTDGEPGRTKLAKTWLDGWDKALKEAYYRKTGFRVEKMVDAYYVSDDDIAESEYYRQISSGQKGRRLG